MKERVLDFFKANSNRQFTPYQVHSQMSVYCKYDNVRIYIDDLIREGKLEMSDRRKPGRYNEPEPLYRLKIKFEGKQTALF